MVKRQELGEELQPVRGFVTIACFFTLAASAQHVNVRVLAQDEHSGTTVKGCMFSCSDCTIVSDSVAATMTIPGGKSTPAFVTHPLYKPYRLNVSAAADTVIVIFLQQKILNLDEVTVSAQRDNRFGVGRLQNIEGTTVYAGKKSELVYVQDLQANLAANTSRQIFSKVPGINVFENDGSGASIGVGARGLNPNRISNFNTRQNGYDISADALGYPESYYTPPAEALERIEILRGAAGLQFGTQFGGMINYRFNDPPANRKMAGNFRQTGGSYGFFNSFNQLGGTVNRVSYNAFYNYRQYEGWRSRSTLNSNQAFASFRFQVNEKLSVKGEYTLLNYLSQQPGGLTDMQFARDAHQVTRNRNWFRVKWNLASASADYKMTNETRFSVVGFCLDAGRDALGYLGRPDRPDDTSAYRNLLSDNYRNYGLEVKMLHRYKLLGQSSHFLIGSRFYKGNTARRQGNADKTDLPSFRFLNAAAPDNSDYLFPSVNQAVFTENVFQLGRKLSITPGARFEHIHTSSEGYYRLTNRNLAGDTLLDMTVPDNRSNDRSFVLGGIGVQYKITGVTELYGNFTQNYRSINFNDMRVVNPNFQVDPLLKDESGHTADAGVRGSVKDLVYFDLGAFMIRYNNRIGTTLKVDSTTYQVVRFRSNIGASSNMGVEAFAELDWMKLVSRASRHRLSTFVNLSLLNAVYAGGGNSYKGKKVEYAPAVIFRSGITWAFAGWSVSYQYAYTGAQFSDATNAETSPSGIYGKVPAYVLMDLSAAYDWKNFGISCGVNNVANTRYFTRRAEGYPGPGIIPADPRNLYCTAKVKF
jgi:Fe(3+) dicitrate transport protein